MAVNGIRRAQLADLARIRVPGDPAISPDGSEVVYVLQEVDSEADANRSTLWRVPAAGGEPLRLTHGDTDRSPAWSPDGRWLAFLRGRGAAAQVWLLPAGAGEPRQLTSLPGGAGAPVWSPDSAAIAFTATVDPDYPSADRPDHAPVVADRLRYKLDGVGLWRGRCQHLFVVDVESGQARQLTAGDFHAGRPAWSPDGRWLAYSAAAADDADLTGESEPYVVAVDSGEQRRVGPGGGMAGVVCWTPAGDALLVVGRQEVRPGYDRLLRVALAGGEVTELAAGLDRNVMPGSPGYPGGRPQYAAGDDPLLFCVRDRGCSKLYALPAEAEPRLLVGGPRQQVAGLSVAARAARAAVVVATPHTFGEIAVYDLEQGELRVLTDYTLPDVALFEPQERVFQISDGTQVQGWLLRDPAARTPGPLLLDIHGGPHNAWGPVPAAGRLYRQILAARGWTVLLLNPRGSDGYGEAFYTAAVGGWGVADERDFLEPIDTLVVEAVADPARLAVTGYSYGGFMTCWLTGRTDRFAAAVPGGPVTDLTSLAGTSDAGEWLVRQEIGALPYEQPEQVDAQSPYRLLGRVETPTLLLQGGADDRCPPGQAEQWFAGLRGRRVPVQLVLYPGSSHQFLYDGRPSHRVDYSRRVVDWVTRHTRTAPSMRPEHWQSRLSELAGRFSVPGAVLAVARGDERAFAVTGVTNVETGVEVTPETMFQIGSITKTLTATAVMRLVDDGRLDLDKPVHSYLPELVLADPQTASEVTLRHLLTHSSGIDGDVFRDTGRGDDCLARYVAGLGDVGQLHPLGEGFSYCNTGFCIAGRVIEVVTGKVWDSAMRDLLFGPLGMTGVATLPEEAILHRVAVGHPHRAGEPARRTGVWSLPRSGAPAGATPCATAGDLLTFAGLQLAGGLAADGRRLLSASAVAAMQAEQVRVTDPYAVADSWGLGWFRLGWGGQRLIGHDGNTVFQSAYLRVLPDHDLAVVLLTNGGYPRDLYETLVREVIEELTGVEMPQPVAPTGDQAEVGRYAGTYQRSGVRYEVDPAGWLRITTAMEVPGLDRPPQELELRPVSEAAYAVRQPGAQTWESVLFAESLRGLTYLHHGLRATPKVA